MRVRIGWVMAAVLLMIVAAAVRVRAQAPAPPGDRTPAPGAPQARTRHGQLVPGQQRPPGDPAQIARGKTLYGVNCTACHGSDLRGGDLGGPNLLRSQVALSDRDGELIVPIIQGARKDAGMPAIPMSPEDAHAVAAYVRSVVGMIGVQGRPPSIGEAPPSILVGNAGEGRAFFESKCSGCHSASGDLQGIATRIPDPKVLQNTWVEGGNRAGRGAASSGNSAHPVTATVTFPSGESVDGKLLQIDDFFVSLELPDGTVRTIRRNGDVPKVDVHDPLKAHKDLLAEYTDQDIHDVTAYLETLK